MTISILNTTIHDMTQVVLFSDNHHLPTHTLPMHTFEIGSVGEGMWVRVMVHEDAQADFVSRLMCWY